MCDTKPCDNCCHEEDLICCMPMMHCCGGYSEHNNCCPHDRCCNHPCCGGCCNPCCCYCKYYKLLQELKDRLTADEDKITNLESTHERDINQLTDYVNTKYLYLLTHMPCSVSYKTVDGVKTFVYTRFTDEEGNTEDVKIVDINLIKNDLAIEYMNDVLAYTGFSDFPIDGEYGGADDVIYIDKSANKIYWYDKNTAGTGRDKYKLLASTTYDDLGNKPVLNTNVDTSQEVKSAEIISGSIKLHKIAKTGKLSDIIMDNLELIQSDWTESNSNSVSFIQHKPSWIGPNKPTYTLDEVTDGTTRKLSDYVKKVKVGANGTELTPNSNGLITLPEYPTASSINVTIGGISYNLETLLTNITNDITALKGLWQKTTDGGYTYLEPVTSTNRVRGYGFYDTTVS